jgi:ferrous iron transport protein B
VENLPDTLWRGLLSDGIVGGVGGCGLPPPILLLFFCVGLLEHTGYMARARVRHGPVDVAPLVARQVVPAVAGLLRLRRSGDLAARTIENRRDRLATIFITPFMTVARPAGLYLLIGLSCRRGP